MGKGRAKTLDIADKLNQLCEQGWCTVEGVIPASRVEAVRQNVSVLA